MRRTELRRMVARSGLLECVEQGRTVSMPATARDLDGPVEQLYPTNMQRQRRLRHIRRHRCFHGVAFHAVAPSVRLAARWHMRLITLTLEGGIQPGRPTQFGMHWLPGHVHWS